MILKIKNWCEEIIIAIILCIIIECLIPKGSNKKYVKVIIGIYILYITLNPFFSILNYNIDFSTIFKDTNNSCEEVNATLNNNMKDVYIVGIEENIKKDIESMGYKVEKVDVFVDINYENIEKVKLKLFAEKNKSTIEPVVISSKSTNENNECYEIIKEHISKNYLVLKENIVFEN